MKRALMVLLSLVLAVPAWAQSQTTPKSSNPPITKAQSASQKSSNAGLLEKAQQKLEEGKKKLQHEIDKQNHKVKTPAAVFGVRG